jgi:chromosome segregation ATPase
MILHFVTVIKLIQDMLNDAEAKAADFQRAMKKEKKQREQAEHLSIDLQKSLLNASSALEQTKAKFEAERAGLLKRAEDAEAKLEPVSQELHTLKNHITAMCVAIFGKFQLPLSSTFTIAKENPGHLMFPL